MVLRWMCGATRRDKIRNEHIRGTTRVVQASKKMTEERLKRYGDVRRMKEEHIVRRMLDVETPEEVGGQTLDGKLQAREIRQRRKGNATNRAEWRRKLVS